MITVKDKADCTGCSACKNICPKNAIKMQEDGEGFLYPAVDAKKCVNCSLCEKICPVINRNTEESKKICCAAYSKDDHIRENSSSGGIFSVLASHIINNGGCVFGAAFDGVTSVKHICANNEESLKKLKASKYMQSEIGTSFKDAKSLLDDGKTVLFTGTPCQIAGLKKFLGKEYDNLYTQDVICHGVPSALIWKKFLKAKEQLENAKIKIVSFRDKSNGWENPSVRYEFYSKAEIVPHNQDLFYNAFIKNITLRPSCYNCIFKNGNSFADLTLGDFWGVNNFLPEINDGKGISIVVCNNNSGEKLLSEIKNSIVFESIDYESATKFNPCAIKPVTKPVLRDLFFRRIKHRNIMKELSLFCSENEKETKKLHFLGDYCLVKEEKGKLFSYLWFIKNIFKYNLR